MIFICRTMAAFFVFSFGSAIAEGKKNEVVSITDSQINNPFYRIIAVSGNSYFRLPLGVTWYKIKKNQRLPENTMLQIGEPGNVKYIFYSRKKGDRWIGTRAALEINTPISLRLRSGLFRQLESIEKYSTKPPKEPEKPEPELESDEEAEETRFRLASAWERVMTFFAKEHLKDFKPDLTAEYSMALGFGFDPIKLLLPAHGKAIFAAGYPIKIQLLWGKIKKGVVYEVFFWPADKYKGRSIARLKSNHYQVTVSKPGSYFVQIAGQNNRYRSEAHLIHVDIPVDRGISHVRLSSPIVPVFPLTGTTLIANESKLDVSFIWSWKAGPKVVNPTFNITAASSKKPTKTIELLENSVSVTEKLIPGSYFWWIEAEALADSNRNGILKSKVKGNENFIRISKSSISIDNEFEFFKKSLEGKVARRIIYWDSGR